MVTALFNRRNAIVPPAGRINNPAFSPQQHVHENLTRGKERSSDACVGKKENVSGFLLYMASKRDDFVSVCDPKKIVILTHSKAFMLTLRYVSII